MSFERPWIERYAPGTPTDITVPDVPITHDLVRNAELSADHPALVFGGLVGPLGNLLLDASISYGELLDTTRRLAAGLQRLGVAKGDRVIIHLPNCPQFVFAYGAALMIGAVAVPSLSLIHI